MSYARGQAANIPFALVNASTGEALTGATVTVYRCLDNGAQAAAAGTVSEKGNGQYNFAATAADMDGSVVGLLFVAPGAVLVHLVIPTGISTLTPAQVNAEVLDVLSVDTLVDGKTIASALQIIGATAAGKISGAGTDSEVFLGLDGLTARVTVVADSSGNRTSVSYA